MTAELITTVPEAVSARTAKSYGSYIAGKNVEGHEWVHVITPRAMLDDSFASFTLKRRLDSGEAEFAEASDIVAGRVAVADDAMITQTLTHAAAAARQWRSQPLSVRVDGYIDLLREALLDNREAIVEMLTLEGHPRDLAKWEFSGFLSGTRSESKEFLREQLWRESRTNGRRQIVRRQPDGVVCVNPPANAPMSSILLSSLALCAGNAVVFRVPRSVPLGAMFAVHELIGPVLDQLGAPTGTVGAICGNPAPVLDVWLRHEAVDDIMYFGSSTNGLKFEQDCVAAGKKPVLELAGNDTVLVWKDANLDYVVQALVESFYGSGQLCMIPNRVVAHPAIADDLIDLLAAAARKLRPGYPDEEGVLLSPVLRQDGFFDCLADAVAKGAEIVTGGKGMAIDGSRDTAGFFLEPTVLRVDGLDHSKALAAVEHETFFPLLPVVVPRFADDASLLDDFIDFINSNLYGLRNSIWASDEEVVDRVVSNVVNGGLLKVNDSHIAFSAPLPTHGGTGRTGGAFGQANYPALSTSHLQGVSILDGSVAPNYAAEYPHA